MCFQVIWQNYLNNWTDEKNQSSMLFKITFIFFENGTWYLFARKMLVWVGVKVGGMFIYLHVFRKLTAYVTYHLQCIMVLVTATTEFFSTCWSPCELLIWNYLTCMAPNMKFYMRKLCYTYEKTEIQIENMQQVYILIHNKGM